jgi:hypothetical protein
MPVMAKENTIQNGVTVITRETISKVRDMEKVK